MNQSRIVRWHWSFFVPFCSLSFSLFTIIIKKNITFVHPHLAIGSIWHLLFHHRLFVDAKESCSFSVVMAMISLLSTIFVDERDEFDLIRGLYLNHCQPLRQKIFLLYYPLFWDTYLHIYKMTKKENQEHVVEKEIFFFFLLSIEKGKYRRNFSF